MRRQIKRVVATLLTASLIAPMCYGNKVSNAEMVKKNVTATAVDEDGSDGLTEITELHAASVDNKIEVRIWKNEEGKIFYSAYRNGHVTLKCVPLGIVAKSVDLSTGLQVDEESYELKKGKEEYLYDEKALERYRRTHTGEFTLQRYKGLGEMDAEQLWETTLNPENRVLKRVEIEDARMASEITEMLMGSDVPPRRQFIYDHADEAEIDA